MDFNQLRQIQKEERDKSRLAEVTQNFDEEIKEFLHPNVTNIHSARSMKICAEDVLRRRLFKIMNHTASQTEITNMTESEEEFHNSLKKNIKKFMENRDYEF